VASVKLTGKCFCFSQTLGSGPRYAATFFDTAAVLELPLSTGLFYGWMHFLCRQHSQFEILDPTSTDEMRSHAAAQQHANTVDDQSVIAHALCNCSISMHFAQWAGVPVTGIASCLVHTCLVT
jgi:hypothetical protein